MSDTDDAQPDSQKPLKPVVLQPGETVAGPRRERERAVWDVALSIILMIFSLVAFFTGTVISLLGIAFFGSCTAGGCTGAVVTLTGLLLLIVLIVGFVATIVALRLRFRAWWIAAVMLGTILVGWFLSYVLAAFGV